MTKERYYNVNYSRNYSRYSMVIRDCYFNNNWWIYSYLVGYCSNHTLIKSYTRKANSLKNSIKGNYENHKKYWISIIRGLVDFDWFDESCSLTNSINGFNLIYSSNRIRRNDCSWKIELKNYFEKSSFLMQIVPYRDDSNVLYATSVFDVYLVLQYFHHELPV